MAPSLTTILVAGLVAVTTAFPTGPRLSPRLVQKYDIVRRQAAGIDDFSIAQFALTLEWLEATFYQQARKNIPAEQMLSLGLSQQQVDDIFKVGGTEFEHVALLQTTLANSGVQPVAPCEYKFDAAVTDPTTFLQTAAVLENVGVSAYLGAAPLVASKDILSTAGSILTVEARHQTFIRSVLKSAAVPSAFDTPLGPKAVFTLAAPFIVSCPVGSNLVLTPNPTLTAAGPASAGSAVAGVPLQLSADGSASGAATHCAFTSGDILPGGTNFVPFDAATGACTPPSPLRGIVYVSLTNAGPLDGLLTDDITVAGPMVMQFT